MPPTRQEAWDEAADALPAASGLRYQIAQVISSVVHPLVFPLVAIIVIGYANNRSVQRTAELVLLTAGLAALPVALVVLIQVKRGVWSDYDVSHRRERYTLYPFALVCLGFLALLYIWLGAIYALRCTIALALANVIDGFINLWWKVSAHATTAAACATLLWYFVPVWGPPAAFSALLVGWSRVELGRHTPRQVLAGWAVGAISSLSALYLFHS